MLIAVRNCPRISLNCPGADKLKHCLNWLRNQNRLQYIAESQQLQRFELKFPMYHENVEVSSFLRSCKILLGFGERASGHGGLSRFIGLIDPAPSLSRFSDPASLDPETQQACLDDRLNEDLMLIWSSRGSTRKRKLTRFPRPWSWHMELAGLSVYWHWRRREHVPTVRPIPLHFSCLCYDASVM
ncbi:hypothetical protein BBK36DRAFT_1136846 [Trichoderma citrinoviride]|uniref:Uncharacterized protein n=1 Tax=Trichoderma citrinoviride TaxID=58853 RepID=A0A2T4BLH5_9HYPO|nr:hypothetical protein BBK36DRAFT_1136846 [Trichoderma citrinoviride]PTB70168.1 hypothetical protein BBK36DRAFT_1136846 [Trichoderma citrinoviride]